MPELIADDIDRHAMIAGDDFTKLLKEVDEPYRMMIGLIAATGLRIGELWRCGGAISI